MLHLFEHIDSIENAENQLMENVGLPKILLQSPTNTIVITPLEV